jgi:hypothetical protein
VLVVHEFVTIETSAKKLAANHSDLTAFVKRISRGAFANVESGKLCGPIVVPGSPLFGRPRARSRVRERGGSRFAGSYPGSVVGTP